MAIWRVVRVYYKINSKEKQHKKERAQQHIENIIYIPSCSLLEWVSQRQEAEEKEELPGKEGDSSPNQKEIEKQREKVAENDRNGIMRQFSM